MAIRETVGNGRTEHLATRQYWCRRPGVSPSGPPLAKESIPDLLQYGAMPTKSILLSSTYFPPQVGGISALMRGAAGALGASEVACVTGVREAPRTLPGSGVRVYRRPGIFGGNRLTQTLAVGAAVAELTIREHPQLLQVATVYDGLPALMISRLTGWPLVVWAHGNEILGLGKETYPRPRQAILKASRVIANSRFTHQLLLNVGVSEDRIRIFPPRCDVAAFTPGDTAQARSTLGLPEEWGPVVLSVGGLVERKGHDTVIAALPTVLREFPTLQYLIVGDGPNRGTLERMVQQHGVSNHVRFEGRVTDEQLPLYYRACDAFAMVSRDRSAEQDVEGFGIVFLEAAATGKPSVGGRSGGIADAVLDGQTGLLVDPTGPEDTADAILRLLRDPALATRLGAEGRRRTEAGFTWESGVTELRRILAEAVQLP